MQRKLSISIVLLIIFSLLGSSLALAQDNAVQRTRAERAEIRFLEGMIDHHQMALDMAADCLGKAITPSVQTLCQGVINAQSAEILTMRGWLLAWYQIDYQPMPMNGGSNGMGMDMGMMPDGMMPDGMMSDDMMAMMMQMMEMMMSDGLGNDASGMSNDMPMMEMMQILNALQTVTLGDLMTMTADVDPTTPFIDVLRHHINNMSADMPMDMSALMPLLENMRMGQMMLLFAQLQTLTLQDIQDMMGHLDDPTTKTLMELMQHHLETMVDDDHSAHHPEGDATPEVNDGSDHADDHPAGDVTPMPDMPDMPDMPSMDDAGGDHANDDMAGPPPTTGMVDPAMTMGMFAGFSYLTGVDYEIAWLEAMIDHHDDALHMSNRILAQAVHEELATFAQGIIDAQTAEIATMETLITELSAQ